MITIIDYGSGNSASVSNVLKQLDCEFIISNKEEDICKADKIIFPGVGEASYSIQRLYELHLFPLLKMSRKPFLGICLGMQLMCEFSKEGDSIGLGVLPLATEIFDTEKVKVPHMGWNQVNIIKKSKLFSGIYSGEYFYFANSYYVPNNSYGTSVCNYGTDFCASFEKNNFYGVQFHPEKSGPVGIQIIKNFIELC